MNVQNYVLPKICMNYMVMVCHTEKFQDISGSVGVLQIKT